MILASSRLATLTRSLRAIRRTIAHCNGHQDQPAMVVPCDGHQVQRLLLTVGLISATIVIVIAGGSRGVARSLTRLTIQIWDVQNDEKHVVIASKSFTEANQAAGGIVSDRTLQQVGRWVSSQVSSSQNPERSVRTHVHVPADLTRDKLVIQMTPPGPAHIYFWVVGASAKSRHRYYDQRELASLGQDFWLEIDRSGYSSHSVQVPWGKVLDQVFTLSPTEVNIAIEEFSGKRNTLATQLTKQLSRIGKDRFRLVDPATRKQLQDEIARHKYVLAHDPRVQQPLRRSLGLEFIISGRCE